MRFFHFTPPLNTLVQRNIVERVCIGANIASQIGIQLFLDYSRSHHPQPRTEPKTRPEPAMLVLAKP